KGRSRPVGADRAGAAVPERSAGDLPSIERSLSSAPKAGAMARRWCLGHRTSGTVVFCRHAPRTGDNVSWLLHKASAVETTSRRVWHGSCVALHQFSCGFQRPAGTAFSTISDVGES